MRNLLISGAIAGIVIAWAFFKQRRLDRSRERVEKYLGDRRNW